MKTSEKTLPSSTPSLKKRFYAALVGTVAVALCCFTPVLVTTLGVVGLSGLTPYLDYVLLPGLAVLIIVTVLSYRSWKRAHNRDSSDADL